MKESNLAPGSSAKVSFTAPPFRQLSAAAFTCCRRTTGSPARARVAGRREALSVMRRAAGSCCDCCIYGFVGSGVAPK